MVNRCENMRNIPVLFLTALQDNFTVKNAFDANSRALTVNYIVKPFNTTIFLSSVETLLKIQEYSETLVLKNRKIEKLLKNIDQSNKYLINRLSEILKDHTADSDKISLLRELMNMIMNNDLPLVKLVTKLIETKKEALELQAGENAEHFKVLSDTVEPLKDVIRDVVAVAQYLVDIGILIPSDLRVESHENAAFFDTLKKKSSTGEISGQLLENFAEMLDVKFENNTIALD